MGMGNRTGSRGGGWWATTDATRRAPGCRRRPEPRSPKRAAVLTPIRAPRRQRRSRERAMGPARTSNGNSGASRWLKKGRLAFGMAVLSASKCCRRGPERVLTGSLVTVSHRKVRGLGRINGYQHPCAPSTAISTLRTRVPRMILGTLPGTHDTAIAQSNWSSTGVRSSGALGLDRRAQNGSVEQSVQSCAPLLTSAARALLPKHTRNGAGGSHR